MAMRAKWQICQTSSGIWFFASEPWGYRSQQHPVADSRTGLIRSMGSVPHG